MIRMGSTVTAKHWADGPFKLIQTPEFREKASFTEEVLCLETNSAVA